MSRGFFLHDPESTEMYTAEWADVLQGATIQTSTWSILPVGPTIAGQAIGADSASCVVSGVLEGVFYTLTNELTWVGGFGPVQRSTYFRGGQR